MSEDKDIRYKKSMLKAHIRAYIKRGINAGIPERFLRIGPDKFKSILSDIYHTKDGAVQLTDLVYNAPEKLMKIPFIVIDGGSSQARKQAAFAIVFRLIICDKFAKFFDCRALVHKLNQFDTKGGQRRTELADDLKELEVLMISEFYPSVFNEHQEGHQFMDEILDSRFNHLHPTVITFQEPPQKITTIRCGVHLQEISNGSYAMDKKDFSVRVNPTEDILRIRVK